jgi:hypothetical protein
MFGIIKEDTLQEYGMGMGECRCMFYTQASS